MKKILALILTLLLALSLIACDSGEPATTTEAPKSDAVVMGEGATVFYFSVVDLEGSETNYEIHTDAATVGEALLALELISGEEGEFGLYIKEVCGITADYEVDGTYWAFYVDGEYGMEGVDLTEITAGAAYSLVQTEG